MLPCDSRVGNLVPVSAVSVARSELRLPTNMAVVLSDYLEDIVGGRILPWEIPVVSHYAICFIDMICFIDVFPAPGEPVTGRSKSVQHEIVTKDGRPVRSGQAVWHRPVSERNRNVLRIC